MKVILTRVPAKALTLMDNIVYSTVKDLGRQSAGAETFRAAPERKQRDACCCW